ncbi:hypothetical protein Cch01nite_26630 [Cellulomonas chitinilytica]|uniref:Protein-glutamine gamma-glutamyltransferase-like C-terminal domain-containing protein n=1 Tax=Cellulomonas chitinilytica TaxID=398759 RepID=A0A919U3A2_9CELL|nr:hypothetical protein Cch01nite_26630 [Cellulomonas chitinilytica]
MAQHSRLPAAVLGVGALVVVTVLAAAASGPWSLDVKHGGEVALPAPTAASPRSRAFGPRSLAPLTPSDEGTAPPWVTFVVLVLLTVVVVVLLLVLVRWLARLLRAHLQPLSVDHSPPAEAVDETADRWVPAMQDGVRRATQELDDEQPPGDAVIAAWVALEHAAASGGLVRDRAETATEFTVEVLDATSADPTATRTLLDLYLAARYSRHPLTARDVARARTSLATIANGLASRREEAHR